MRAVFLAEINRFLSSDNRACARWHRIDPGLRFWHVERAGKNYSSRQGTDAD